MNRGVSSDDPVEGRDFDSDSEDIDSDEELEELEEGDATDPDAGLRVGSRESRSEEAVKESQSRKSSNPKESSNGKDQRTLH
jgi:hypothetical protein